MLTKTLLDFSKMDWDQVQYPWCDSIGWLILRVKKSTFNLNYWMKNYIKKKKTEKKLKNRSEKLMWEEVG